MNPPAAVDRQYLPGDFAIWIFIFAELLVFGIFFLSYAFARAGNVELFNECQLLLDRESGALNTVLLITSSYFVVRAVNAIRDNAATACARWLGLAVLAGACFVVIKLRESGATCMPGLAGTGIMMVLPLPVTLKGQMVADYFMGLRGVRSRWRWVVTGWLLSVVAMIGLAYLPGEN